MQKICKLRCCIRKFIVEPEGEEVIALENNKQFSNKFYGTRNTRKWYDDDKNGVRHGLGGVDIHNNRR